MILFFIVAKKLPPDVNKSAVFACNELDLKEVNIYGLNLLLIFAIANYLDH